jgi:hypothetical protein
VSTKVTRLPSQGSKVEQEGLDMILTRELVKGTDTYSVTTRATRCGIGAPASDCKG